jgi:predicted nucleic acid-binding protein
LNIYLDASAAVKLLVDEAETAALQAFLTHHEDAVTWSSRLLETELRRACRRWEIDQGRAADVLDRFELFDLHLRLFMTAGLLPGEHLGSLDALHVATALETEMDQVITYDVRMQQALDDVGLDWVAPT